MKKLTLVLSLVVALTLCMGAFSFSAAEGDPTFYCYETIDTANKQVGTGTLTRVVNYAPNGYLPVTAIGNGNNPTGCYNDDGTITFGTTNQVDWVNPGSEQVSANGTWWAAPIATYTTAVSANTVVVPCIGGTGSWSGDAYPGDFTDHTIYYADDYNGVWTEIESFDAERVEHDGSFMQADWGYAGGILVYSFEEVEAKYFMVSFGDETLMFQRAYAAYIPAAAADTTVADTTEAEATDAVATTEAEATDAAVATTEAVADETTGEGAADTADFAIASVALAAVAAAGVVLCSKKRK